MLYGHCWLVLCMNAASSALLFLPLSLSHLFFHCTLDVLFYYLLLSRKQASKAVEAGNISLYRLLMLVENSVLSVPTINVRSLNVLQKCHMSWAHKFSNTWNGTIRHRSHNEILILPSILGNFRVFSVQRMLR